MVAAAAVLAALVGSKLVSADATTYRVNARCNLDQLMRWFSSDTGLWNTYWWTGAGILTAFNDFAYLDDSVKDVYGHVWDDVLNNAPNNRPYKMRKARSNDDVKRYTGWTNNFYDDEGWWVLALLGSYDNTGDQAQLQAAITLWEDIDDGFGTHVCGGIPWKKEPATTGPLAIPNSLYITASAAIANRVGSNTRQTYLDAALKGWDWFKSSELIGSDNLVADGIDVDTCKSRGDAVYTYNQGSIIGGLVELAHATGDDSYLDTASDIADAVIADDSPMVQDGILVDGCDKDQSCDGDGIAFKGVFARNLRRLYLARPTDSWKDFLQNNAQSIWNNDLSLHDDGCFNGVYWAGPYTDKDAPVAQGIALDALTAALATTL
ncbi:Glycosyl hydrolase family 76 [Geosmithia morbida]|uniref:Glycosyl hydrolase family 76 n=1 Tax=Geosmithia morbida TaxID=1094350 RepID=A0A9P4YNG1_9HYPO|nr:Glycosyl hydrolase family 76 [Geosmithia morbida]KAF4119682.1 Glycosyl hydrolase family 76 [Geosmithia morbida]